MEKYWENVILSEISCFIFLVCSGYISGGCPYPKFLDEVFRNAHPPVLDPGGRLEISRFFQVVPSGKYGRSPC